MTKFLYGIGIEGENKQQYFSLTDSVRIQKLIMPSGLNIWPDGIASFISYILKFMHGTMFAYLAFLTSCWHFYFTQQQTMIYTKTITTTYSCMLY
jgi:hypothetical protein